jgi:hypothetical protein
LRLIDSKLINNKGNNRSSPAKPAQRASIAGAAPMHSSQFVK